MKRSKIVRHIAACSISLPSLGAAPPKLAKETVYMPSSVAARVLGRPDSTRRNETNSATAQPQDRSAA